MNLVPQIKSLSNLVSLIFTPLFHNYINTDLLRKLWSICIIIIDVWSWSAEVGQRRSPGGAAWYKYRAVQLIEFISKNFIREALGPLVSPHSLSVISGRVCHILLSLSCSWWCLHLLWGFCSELTRSTTLITLTQWRAKTLWSVVVQSLK